MLAQPSFAQPVPTPDPTQFIVRHPSDSAAYRTIDELDREHRLYSLPESGGLLRTAQIQPGVFYTFEAPFVRVLALYSGTLEDPGVIADHRIGSSPLDYLRAALGRVHTENYAGALILAHHHPAYTAGAKHGTPTTTSASPAPAATRRCPTWSPAMADTA